LRLFQKHGTAVWIGHLTASRRWWVDIG